jgi:peptide/nickel transport system permease protein
VLALVLRRLLLFPPLLVGISLVVFLAVHAAPGDPAELRPGGVPGEEGTGESPDAAAAAFRERNLLDRPLARQYLHFLGPFDLSPRGHAWFGGSGADPWHGLLALDLGGELHRPSVGVLEELARRLRVTVPLAACAALLAYGLAIPLGLWSSRRRGTRADGAVSLVLFGVDALPSFWVALMLVLVFGAAGLDWLPTLGLASRGAQDWSLAARALDVALHALLPVLTLALGSLAYLSRQMRAGLLEALPSGFVLAARAKGLSERQALVRHALPNALLPILTLAAAVLPALVGGSIVVETVFDLPGVGRYAYEGLVWRDYSVVLATATLSAAMTLVGLALSDLACAWLDPRIRHG